MITLPKFSLNSYSTILGVALFIVITANMTFFEKVTELYPIADNYGFLLALSLLVWSILVFMMALASLIIPVRPLCIALLLAAAIFAYFADIFGTVIDVEMLRNTLETNVSESTDLVTTSMILRTFFLAVIPGVFLYFLQFKKESRLQQIACSGVLVTSAFALAVICIFSNGSQFASFFREHKSVRYYITPSYSIYSAALFISDYFKSPESKELISLNTDVKKVITGNSYKKNLVIMVVGETARADHFSLNGYARNTNEFTSKEKNLVNYTDIKSCGTSTAISVPCMFAYQGNNGFDVQQARRTENILDLLDRAGVSVLWRDNNSDSKGMAERVTYESYRTEETNAKCDIECRDMGMLDGLEDYIGEQSGDVFIVLHQMGNHGPAYFKRYPEAFNQYQPVCNTAELSGCTETEIINAYDNSIRYTDYFLSKVITFLKSNTSYNTSMLYVSDHGESLGEKGLYLHGMPYSFAPEAQTHVPMLVWADDNSPIDLSATQKLKQKPNSHDAIFDTLLTLFDLRVSLPPASKTPLVVLKENTSFEIGKR